MKYKSLLMTLVIVAITAGCGGGDEQNRSTIEKSFTRLASSTSSNSATFTGIRGNYTISKTSTGYHVADNTGIDVTRDLPSSTTLFVFADVSVSFDTVGSAGKAYRLYQAAFNRIPDIAGLGFQITQLNNGVSLESVANGFITSAEFIKLYSSTLTNRQFVEQLYLNVLHRSGDSAGIDFWVNALSNGGSCKTGETMGSGLASQAKRRVWAHPFMA